MSTCLLYVALLAVAGWFEEDPPPSLSPTPETINKLVEQLKDDDYQKSFKAAFQLGKFGAEAKLAVPALLIALDDERKQEGVLVPDPLPTVGSYAADALAKIGAAAVPGLLKRLDNPDEPRKLLVISVLHKIGKPGSDAAPKLKSLANTDPDKWVRYYAMLAFSQTETDPREAVSFLIRQLDHKEAEFRDAAIQYLGTWKADAVTAVVPLTRLLSNEEMRPFAYSLHAYGQRAVRYDVATTLGAIGPGAKSALDKLQEMRKGDSDKIVRISAALAICRIDGASSKNVGELVRLLVTPNLKEEATREAAAALAELGQAAKVALPELEAMFRDENCEIRKRGTLVRSSLLRAIANIRGVESLELLRSALKDQEVWVRYSAAEGLGALGPAAKPAVPDLVAAIMKDSSEADDYDSIKLNPQILYVLGKLGSTSRDALIDLERLSKDENFEFHRDRILHAIEVIRTAK